MKTRNEYTNALETLLENVPQQTSDGILTLVECLITDCEDAFNEIHDTLKSIEDVTDLHMVSDAMDMAKDYGRRLY